MFTLHEYTHVKPGTALKQIGCFVVAVVGLVWAVGKTYPDRPSAPREFDGGLEQEYGGPRAVRVGLFVSHQCIDANTTKKARAPGDS